MNLLTLLAPKNQPFAAYEKLKEKIAAVGVKSTAATAYYARLQAAVVTAQKAFDGDPDVGSLEKLDEAINRKKAYEASYLPAAIGNAVESEMGRIKDSPEARQVYLSCFKELEASMAQKIAGLEASLQKALKEAGLEGENGLGEPDALKKLRGDLVYVNEGRSFIENTMDRALNTNELRKIEQVLDGAVVDFVGPLRQKPLSDPFIAKNQPTQADLDRQQAESAPQTIFFHGAVP